LLHKCVQVKVVGEVGHVGELRGEDMVDRRKTKQQLNFKAFAERTS
jgi:hypothetical protein